MAYTRLQLCQRYAKEAGISGASNSTLPTSTLAQTGEMLDVVNDIDSAYEKLQNMKPNWHFLRFDFSFPTISGTQNYTPTDAGYPEHKTWKADSFRCYLTATGTDDEQDLCFVPWEDFRDLYLLGSQRDASGRPIKFTIKPDKSVSFYPKPDAIYTVVGEYWKRAQAMGANATEPLMPDEFHLILVWMALMKYGLREAAQEKYALGLMEYNALIGPLKTTQLPPMETAGPMA